MKTRSHGVSVQLLNETLAISASRGVNSMGILHSVGIDPSILRTKSNRISADDYGRVWVAIAAELDDEFFGEDPHPMRRGSFALMAQATLSAPNGEQALRRAVRFMHMVLDNLEGRISISDDYVRLEIVYRKRPTMFAYATYFILIYGLLCWLVGRRIPVIKAALDCDEPAAADEYRLMFCDDMSFSSKTSFVDLSPSFLSLPVIQSAKTLGAFLRGAPGNFVAKYRRSDSLATRINRILESLPPEDWPDGTEMARFLGQAPATMRRRLCTEGVNYQAVKDRARFRLAKQLLKTSNKSVFTIALEIGYAEPSAFHRAFLKWTGVTPNTYRSRTTPAGSRG